jgi:hypothetical protein
LAASLVETGTLCGEIRIPDTVGNLVVTADLRARSLTCHVDIDAPKEGRPKTRVNWLLRQLKEAPGHIRVEVFSARSRGAGAADLLAEAREDPMRLLPDPAREPRSFRVALSAPMGTKRGRGRGSFIDSVSELIDDFYGEVMQHLKAWSAAPPRMRSESGLSAEESGAVGSALSSTAFSSQDGPESPESPAEVPDLEPARSGAG